MTQKKSLFMSALNGVDIVRKVIINVLFFGFIALFLLILFLMISSKDSRIIIPQSSTLLLDLEGAVVEQYSSTPLDRALQRLSGREVIDEHRHFDIISSLLAASADDRITQVYIKTDKLRSVGYAQAREIAATIQKVRNAGKKVIAFGTHMDQKQYLIAASADEVYIDPQGGIILEGLANYRQYYREGLQDKLGVNVHLFRVGEFKSAAEPFIMDHASEESKEADLYWMNDVWGRYVNDIAQARNLTVETINEQISNFPALVEQENGDLAQLAVNNKWVDGLKTEEDMEMMLAESGSYDSKNKTYAHVDLSNYRRDVVMRQAATKNTVAVVVAQGQIVDGDGGLSSVGGDDTSEMLKEVRENEQVKAVVLRVDSPGGSVFASEQIRREIEQIRKSGRPVIVSMGNTAASGGYWISMNADLIVADPSTVTGSIGIFGLVPDVSQALEKIGVRTDGVSTTDLAGYNPARPLDSNTSRIIQSVIGNGYDQFISRVANARGFSKEEADAHGRGRVWSGAQAQERHLVDELGGMTHALRRAYELAQLNPDQTRVVLIETGSTSLTKMLSGANQYGVLAQIGGSLGLWQAWSETLPPQMKKDAMMFHRAAKTDKIVEVYAHCLCEI